MLTDKATAEKFGIERLCGYWEAANTYFFDKAECLRFATRNSIYDIKYHFFDSAYRSLDWTKEPEVSLDSLYKERAQQLRDKYDYLILAFSGGADSSNILKAFVENNIRLDEVYCEYPISVLKKPDDTSYSSKDPEYLTYEWYTAAKPALEKLSKTNPEIKITVDDVSAQTIRLIESGNLHLLFRSGYSANPNTVKYYRLYEIARTREDKGRVGCITGLDKPRIAYNKDTGAFYSNYSDFNNAFSGFPDETFKGYQARMEYFYYSPELPQLNQKQCFVLKKAVLGLLQSNDMAKYASLLINSTLASQIHIYDVHDDFFKKALYPSWDTSIWQAKKSPNFFYTPASQWFYDTEITSDRARSYFDGQLKELVAYIDDRFISYDKGKPSAFKHIMTQAIVY